MKDGRHAKRWIRLHPLLGVIVVAALIAWVVIAYTANSGLPWSSSYDIYAAVPNADRLIATDEVRIGGVRVGQVSSVTAHLAANGTPDAILGLSLATAVGRVPVDTTVEVQSASILGQTYVDLILGRSHHRLALGGTLPLRNARPTVALTDLLDIFNSSTAAAIRSTITNTAYGVAGRGPAINQTLGATATLLEPFTHVAAALAAPGANLPGLLHGVEAIAGALAPVSTPLASLVNNAAITLAAVDQPRALADAIALLPSTEQAASTALATLHAPLQSLASLMTNLRPAGVLLPGTLTSLDHALADGIAPLTRTPRFAAAVGRTLVALGHLSRPATTAGALRQLVAALRAGTPVLDDLTTAQLYCNVLGIYARSFPTAWGTIGNGQGPSYVAAGLVTDGATNQQLQSAKPAANLHVNYLPHENADECESGNEPYSSTSQDLTNPPGNQSRTVPSTSPPAGVTGLAEKAGLLNAPPGTPR